MLTTTVPFNDLARSTAAVRAEVDAALARVLNSGWFVLGEEGEAFEREFAAFCGAAHAVGVGSGTDAIELATGQPDAIASSGGSPNVSCRLGKTRAAAVR